MTFRIEKLKPTIPELGENNIPVCDEHRLEKTWNE